MQKIKLQWEKDHHEKIIINAASTGILARQIENGAQADIFISANGDWMDYLTQTNAIENLSKSQQSQPTNIASNRLAIVAPYDSHIDSMELEELLAVLLKQKDKISMGDPGHVPLGKYTKESLEFYKVFEKLSSELINAKNARSVLRLVEIGEVTFGFVYLSDAYASEKVKIVAVIPEESHQIITYQAIIVNDSKSKTSEFLKFISSEETKKIWAEMGFKG